MNNIYVKYCNDIQNPALGAYALAIFVHEYNQKSKKGKASLLYLFIIMPLLMNKTLRSLIVNDSYKKQKKLLSSLTRELCSNENTIGILNSNIRNYQEYTLTSFIFALRLGLLSINNRGELTPKENLRKNINIVVYAAEVLGNLFATGDFNAFIAYTGVQL